MWDFVLQLLIHLFGKGEGEHGRDVGKYGHGRRNERGEKLVEFCKEKKLMVTNTWFEQENRRRYTWKQPGDTNRYQLDYILVRQRYRNSVKKSCSYPGADVGSDHNLVMMKIKVKHKVLKKAKIKKRWNLEKLEEVNTEFQRGVEERLVKKAAVETTE